MKLKTQNSKLGDVTPPRRGIHATVGGKTPRKALITGITGQDGSYLAELLLSKGYDVHGVVRRASQFNTHRIDHIYQDPHEKGARLRLHYGDLNDASSLNKLIRDVRPDEIYNLAAQSHVKVSFDVPEYTGEITGLGTIRMLEAIREAGFETRFYQASSSELYGKVVETPQTETTPFYPRSPYAAAKAYAFYVTRNYREAYGMFACNGILFNHEGPRRGETFVTRKITRALARIKYGLQDTLYLGNLDAKRDWGFAGDYVEAMWLMLQHDTPDDYVIATGQTRSVREFVGAAFACAGMEIQWRKARGAGRSLNPQPPTEVGVERKTGKVRVAVDPRYFRPSEVDLLLGDASKARRVLGWRPKVGFEALVEMMVGADMETVRRQVEGHREKVCEKEMH